jgi:phage-related protein
MTWIVEILDARVRDELESLPDDMKARFRRIVELIQGHGLECMREPHVRVFIKKTQKTPRREIDLALERAEEVKP